jgi:hypothetical protein
VTGHSGGIFKRVEIHRNIQMQKAHQSSPAETGFAGPVP